MSKKTKKLGLSVFAILTVIVLLLSLTLIVGVDTNWGKVETTRLNLVTPEGDQISALLYKPKDASPDNKVPMLMINHGGSDMFEQMTSYCVELARRGYAALTWDASNHHNSDRATGPSETDPKPTSGLPTMGAETVWNTVKTFDFVDFDKVITAGHSMGGQYSISFAIEHPDEVFLQVNIGMNNYGTADNQQHDFHFVNILGVADESLLARTENDVSRAFTAEQLLRIVSGDYTSPVEALPPIEIGEVYTAIGTDGEEYKRTCYMPDSCHAYYLVTNDAIQTVVYAVTSHVGIGLDEGVNSYADHGKISTVWQWKEVGYILLLAGTVMMMFLVATALLKTKVFSALTLKPVAVDLGFKKKSALWFGAFALLTALPVLLYKKGMLASRNFYGLDVSKIWLVGGNQNGYIAWQWTMSIVFIIFFILYHFLWAKKKGASLQTYGFATSDEGGISLGYIGKALAFGLISVGAGYAAFSIICGYTKQGMHICTFMFSTINPNRTLAIFMYFLFQIPYFLTSTLALKSLGFDSYGNDGKGTLKTIALGTVVTVGGLLVLWLVFVGVLTTQHLIIPGNYFPTDRMYIYGIAIFPLFIGMSIANSLNIYVAKKTNSIWSGLFTALLWGTWVIISTGGMTRYTYW